MPPQGTITLRLSIADSSSWNKRVHTRRASGGPTDEPSLAPPGQSMISLKRRSRWMEHLFTPLTLRGTTLANRIVMSPMCMYAAGDDGQGDRLASGSLWCARPGALRPDARRRRPRSSPGEGSAAAISASGRTSRSNRSPASSASAARRGSRSGYSSPTRDGRPSRRRRGAAPRNPSPRARSLFGGVGGAARARR